MTDTLVNCPVASHSTECLCDVQLPDTPTPINFGLTEVRHAEIVMKHKRLGGPWTTETAIQMMEALGAAAEATAKVAGIPFNDARPASYKEAVRELIRQGHSMLDIPELLDISFLMVKLALMDGRGERKCVQWTEGEWLAFEADILSNNRGGWWLCKNYDLSQTLAHRLVKLYRSTPTL